MSSGQDCVLRTMQKVWIPQQLFGVTVLIAALTDGLTSLPWTFTHNNSNSSNKINHLDLRVTMAASHFATGSFNQKCEPYANNPI